MSLKVNEIFHSIQGESSHAGTPCVFVRLSGCNLRCAYCDTRYAYEEGALREIADIEEEVSRYECGLVEITGGEPLLQAETPVLIGRLLAEGHTVLLETNGSMNIDLVDRKCARIVDIKCPSSGMEGQNDMTNIGRLTERDELKFVVASREDYAFAKELLRSSPAFPCRVNFSPVFGLLPPRSLAEWILKDRLQVRLNLQLHKFIWGPETRGV